MATRTAPMVFSIFQTVQVDCVTAEEEKEDGGEGAEKTCARLS